MDVASLLRPCANLERFRCAGKPVLVFRSCGAEAGFILEDGERSLISPTKPRLKAAAEDVFDPWPTASSSSSELKSI